MAQSESVLSSPPETRAEPLHWTLLLIFGVVLIWSGITPYDRLTWVLEIVPALIALPILIFTFRRFPLTHLVYTLILLHAIVLMVGGHFTYAREPVFEWLKQMMHWPRNNFDKLGHFMQGFVPAMVAREILLRRTPLKRGGWLFFLVVCVCGSISASYELVEWLTAVVGGGKSEEFLGTQGYVWDTQSDMLMAFIGAIIAQFTLSRLQDRQLARMGLSN
jgi:putative membrane protein